MYTVSLSGRMQMDTSAHFFLPGEGFPFQILSGKLSRGDRVIYLDYNATTPTLAEVREVMEPFFSARWGNPSSSHSAGLLAKKAIECAREQISKLVGANASRVVFTSSATEANNLAILSALESDNKKMRIVTAATEHSSVLNYCAFLRKRNVQIEIVPVLPSGAIDLLRLDKAIDNCTSVVSVMWANNETGVINPVEKVAQICAEHEVLFHCDAVQAAGKVDVDLGRFRVDYLSLSSHKIFGPKGAGALVVEAGSPITPLLYGGHQERGWRGGTENVPAIVGFGKAAELALKEMPMRSKQVTQLRDKLEASLLGEMQGAYLNGDYVIRLPNTTNVGFEGIDSETLVELLDQKGICASSGSACLADSVTPSHVVKAMTGSHEKAGEAVRFSLSHFNTDFEIDFLVQELKQIQNQLWTP